MTENAFEQVVVTTPSGEQVLVTKWLKSGNFEVSWRPVAQQSETWSPVHVDDWRVEKQD